MKKVFWGLKNDPAVSLEVVLHYSSFKRDLVCALANKYRQTIRSLWRRCERWPIAMCDVRCAMERRAGGGNSGEHLADKS